jgi:collagenase-like PrtC family protease
MQKEKFLIIPNKKELKLYEEYNFNTFILPLKDYSIGFDIYFDIDEINELSNTYEICVLVNRLLHMDIYKFKDIYSKFNKNIKFIVEDIGLVNIIDKDRLILWENHILSNYKAINYLKTIGINSVVINNDLTINELKTINKECNSNIYYNYISKNMLMYSRRHLVTNFNKYYDIKNNKKEYLLDENVTHKELLINETEYGSVVRYNKIFCASKYLDDLNSFNLIIDFTNIDEINEKMILENYNNKELYNLIDSDYYFLENEIKYKVGDLK